MAENVAAVLSIEWMMAVRGIEFHAPLATSAPLRVAAERLRRVVPPHTGDRFLADDVAAARSSLLAGDLDDLVTASLVLG